MPPRSPPCRGAVVLSADVGEAAAILSTAADEGEGSQTGAAPSHHIQNKSSQTAAGWRGRAGPPGALAVGGSCTSVVAAPLGATGRGSRLFDPSSRSLFFPEHVRQQHALEFETLVQGDMSVSQYEVRFFELSTFTTYVIVYEGLKARSFKNSLLPTFEQIVQRAQVYEQQKQQIRLSQQQQQQQRPQKGHAPPQQAQGRFHAA
ncbi:uncharacterized protein LOC131225165 [Magnolia sinica]|uniref:uncharacterized protein LOC131225165 n=1 Tax=Magnolia sinica TaxID=86752 RepID=UPI0026580462|nr:uncharacterized protein LOC131225165 [Magnolia sinica]